MQFVFFLFFCCLDLILIAINFLVQSFKMVADQMSALEQETPLIKSHVARFGAQALACEVLSLAELAEPFRNGVHYPLFLLCLQSAHRVKDKQWLVDIFNDSKINLQEMLPGKEQDCVCMHAYWGGGGIQWYKWYPVSTVSKVVSRDVA